MRDLAKRNVRAQRALSKRAKTLGEFVAKVAELLAVDAARPKLVRHFGGLQFGCTSKGRGVHRTPRGWFRPHTLEHSSALKPAEFRIALGARRHHPLTKAAFEFFKQLATTLRKRHQRALVQDLRVT